MRNIMERKKKRVVFVRQNSKISFNINKLTIHGLRNVLTSKSTINRLLWILFFLSAACTCSYLVFKGVSDYLEYKVNSKISFKREVPLLFPAVTVCNKNPFISNFSKKFIEESFDKIGIKDYINTQIFRNIFSEENKLQSNIMVLRLFLQVLTLGLDLENRKNLSYPFNKFILSCYFSSKECYEDDFEWYFSLTYGNCFRFNTGRNSAGKTIPLKYSNMPGKFYGLALQLNTGTPEHLEILSKSDGIRIMINNNSDTPQSDEGIDVSTGVQTSIQVKKIVNVHLPKPYSNCIDKNQIDKAIFLGRILNIYNTTYRHDICYLYCFQLMIVETCECDFQGLFTVKYNKSCTSVDKIKCLTMNFIKLMESFKHKECLNNCPPECEDISFSLSISSSLYPSKNFFKALKHNQKIKDIFSNKSFTLSDLREKISFVIIYFEKLNYMTIEDSPNMLFFNLMASIGGWLGLFLGISVLSLVELFEIIIGIFLDRKDKKI